MKAKLISSAILVIATLFSMNAVAQREGMTIPRAAMAVNENGVYAGLFDELLSALQMDYTNTYNGNVTRALGRRGPFTVFAPTDGAFEELKQILACNGLALSDVPDILRTTLQSHAASGMLMAEDVVAASEITTLSGAVFTQAGGVVTDAAGREANIVVTDLVVDNGVIHVIDSVLLPADLGLMACGS